MRLGINTQLEQYSNEDLAENLSNIENDGFEALKQTFNYNPSFDWTSSDRIIQAVAKQDLVMVPLLDGSPNDDFAPVDPALFAEWVGEFSSRYKEELEYYIIWDEPNLTSHWGNRPINSAEYAALLSAAAEEIRNSDPNAKIVAAPLAPTVETGPKNLAAHLYLQALYETGAADSFDVVAGKPYGFETGPDDRNVDPKTLNFSQVILLREIMEHNNDKRKPIWSGNWGWNSLPAEWAGQPSIWGQVDQHTQAAWTIAAIERARIEWPWMGYMFLENWETYPADDPRVGFSISSRSAADNLQEVGFDSSIVFPGFVQSQPDHPAQKYDGQWRFSNEFGADVGETGDRLTFRFWGTDIGLSVRRGDVRARLYATVDGRPANNLPLDDRGATLVLSSPDLSDEYVSIETLASNLAPGEHTLSLDALHGTDQWALNGFSVGYQPADEMYRLTLLILGVLAGASLVMAIYTGRRADWNFYGNSLVIRFGKLGQKGQLLVTAISAAMVAVAGWLTWGEQAAGIYRRLGDGAQLALTATAASIFYISPSFILYITALFILFVLIFLRPAWGLALVAFAIPFHVRPKPFLGYRFSPVEIFLLVTLAAYGLRMIADKLLDTSGVSRNKRRLKLIQVDWAVLIFTLVATLSLLFTNRLDVALNEWRVVILEPALFYLLLRLVPLDRKEMWVILDSFILGGLAVALIGLGQYVTGQNLITSEAGLMRLRSIFGSPNNVALYLGRIIPILFAFLLMGEGRRRILYGLALLFITLAMLLTFSKGAFFLGLPISLLVVLILWRRAVGGRIWPWVIGPLLIGLLVLIVAYQIPQLAGRLDLRGETGFFRMNLWRSSLNMFADNPIYGVGLDNFLYEYRGRYILDAAWQEPNLNHPHNIVLDLGTRLGIIGLAAGLWLIWSSFKTIYKINQKVELIWQPVAIGLMGSFAYILAHGLVDHSLFLTDLAFAFYFLLGLAVWLAQNRSPVDSGH